MKIILNFLAALLLFTCCLHAQVGVGTLSPNPSAVLDLTSTSSGLLPPRMTRLQMLSIPDPATALLVYCSDCGPSGLYIFENTWKTLVPAYGTPTYTANTLSCATAPVGNYFVDVPLNNSNTKSISITVANNGGLMSASTNSNNGVSFSSVSLSTGSGANTIIMYGSGTPGSPGTFPYTVTIGTQTCVFNVTFISNSSGGTSVVSSYDCNGANSGQLLTGISAVGVTHTITANVTTTGTYNIITNTANGVNYSASGTFNVTGAQSVVLNASGTPVVYGNNTFTLNGTPNCSFDVFTNNGSSGGDAVVSAYDCNGGDAGTLIVGVPPSGVTHMITATVTTPGTYNLQAIKNGITFSASGTFPNTGNVLITLTASGTPVYAWDHLFTLNSNPSCSFTRVVSPAGTFTCADAVGAYTPGGPLLLASTTYSGTYTIPYTAGNGTAYGATTVPGSNGYGLTFTRVPGTYAPGGGNVVYNLSGTTPLLLGYEYSQFSVPEGCNTSVHEAFVITYAGTGAGGFVNGPVNTAKFNHPYTVVTDVSGNVYVGDEENHCIRKISNGIVSTFAGSGTAGYADGTGTAAQFNHPTGLCVDVDGNLIVADTDNHRIRKITPAGVVTTLAGSGTAGSANGTGTAAQFNQPWDIVLDGSGNMFIADRSNHKIRKMTPGLVVTNFAGSGVAGFNNATGTAAQFNSPAGLAIDGSGNLYLADVNNHRIRKITSAAVVTTYAGSGTAGAADGTGAAAQFNAPTDVARDGSGNLFIADRLNNKIRHITTGAIVTTVAGIGTTGYLNGYYSNAKFFNPQGLAVDSYGRVIVADSENSVLRVFTPY